MIDTRVEQRRTRMELLETCYDDLSKRRLLAAGLRPGFRCLEVGAGGGSIARWMAERAGPAGSVLATDIDIDTLQDSARPNLEVKRHDIVNEELPLGSFDLVHARLVLMVLPAREHVLGRLARALRPGGVLLTEDHDWVAVQPGATPAYRPAWIALEEALCGAGVNVRWARSVPALLRRRGLVDVGAEADFRIFEGGSDMARLCKHVLMSPEGDLAPELRGLAAAMEEPDEWFVGPASVASSGRRAC